jgi:hypothetical protein
LIGLYCLLPAAGVSVGAVQLKQGVHQSAVNPQTMTTPRLNSP